MKGWGGGGKEEGEKEERLRIRGMSGEKCGEPRKILNAHNMKK